MTKVLVPAMSHLFFLCPDKEYARGLRQFLVKTHGTVVGQVGTLTELTQLAHQKRLLDLDPDAPEQEAFLNLLRAESLAAGRSPFWLNSFNVDEKGVCTHLSQAIEQIAFSRQTNDTSPWGSGVTNTRQKTRLDELCLLVNKAKAARALPAQLQKTIDILECPFPALVPIQVIVSRHVPQPGALIAELFTKLELDCKQINSNAEQLEAYRETLKLFDQQFDSTPIESPSATNLQLAARALFEGFATKEPWLDEDGSLRWLRCRDRIESIELVLGVIQKRKAEDPQLEYSDFGLLLPCTFDAHNHLKLLFDAAGVPLANLQWVQVQRNLAGELLTYALMAFEGGTPKLAIKSLLTNPLMPWDAKLGSRLAKSVDEYGFEIKIPHDLPQIWRNLIKVFNTGASRTQLASALAQLLAVLKLDELPESQVNNVHAQFDLVMAAAQDVSISFDQIRALVSLNPLEHEQQVGPFVDGVTVFYEDKLPWRKVKYLHVLDFNAGSYPAHFQNSAVLSDAEWQSVQAALGSVPLARDLRNQAKDLLRKQLACVENQVLFFCPAFDEKGKPIKPSESLIDFALLAQKVDKAETLLTDVLNGLQERSIAELKYHRREQPAAPRFDFQAQDLELKMDLLSHWKKKIRNEETGEGIETVKPQSPSSLDDLLICPLGWLLKQLGANSHVWEPDGFTPMTSGLIAHDVLEKLFALEQEVIPSALEIEERIHQLFEDAVKKKAPYLNNSIWKVERNNLIDIVRRSALAWAELLNQLGANVVAPELWLEGTFDGHPIHGQTDCVIALPDRGVLVVDFKTAKADKYEKRMKAKVDLQASLYEQMLKTGGPKNQSDVEKAKNADLKKLNGVVYFTLKDRVATSNYKPEQSLSAWNAITPVDEIGLSVVWSQDVSSDAMEKLRSRFTDLRRGFVPMTRTSEIEEYRKQGFGEYIFQASPLVAASIVNDQATADDDEEGDD